MRILNICNNTFARKLIIYLFSWKGVCLHLNTINAPFLCNEKKSFHLPINTLCVHLNHTNKIPCIKWKNSSSLFRESTAKTKLNLHHSWWYSYYSKAYKKEIWRPEYPLGDREELWGEFISHSGKERIK